MAVRSGAGCSAVPSTSSWPTKSSRSSGRIRTARGACSGGRGVRPRPGSAGSNSLSIAAQYRGRLALMSMDRPSEEKLRLGGMALRNGLLVHGPTHWAAAVRAGDGRIATASGRKPRIRGVEGVPGVRGVARLAEAMAVIPLVKRALPEAQLPFEDTRVLGMALGTAVLG